MMPRVLPDMLFRCLRRASSTGSIHGPASSNPQTTTHGLFPTSSQLHRLNLFESEQVRQRDFLQKRVSKMYVHYQGLPENVTLLMNRGLSTPYECAAHVQEHLCRRSVVALVDGQPWDMNRPIDLAEDKEDCTLQLRHFKESNPSLANHVFWRSCSFLLGAVVEAAFKAKFAVHPCSFPPPNLESGSFVYDFRLVSPNGTPKMWVPSSQELRVLSMTAQRMALDELPFEPLDIDVSLATEMFVISPLKAAQIPAIAENWKGPGNPRVTVYRVGHHVDLSRGPLMSNTGQIGRFSVTAVHHISSPSYGPLLRFQGVALPPDFLSHFTTFDILSRRAANLNTAPVPSLRERSPPGGDVADGSN